MYHKSYRCTFTSILNISITIFLIHGTSLLGSEATDTNKSECKESILSKVTDICHSMQRKYSSAKSALTESKLANKTVTGLRTSLSWLSPNTDKTQAKEIIKEIESVEKFIKQNKHNKSLLSTATGRFNAVLHKYRSIRNEAERSKQAYTIRVKLQKLKRELGTLEDEVESPTTSDEEAKKPGNVRLIHPAKALAEKTILLINDISEDSRPVTIKNKKKFNSLKYKTHDAKQTLKSILDEENDLRMSMEPNTLNELIQSKKALLAAIETQQKLQLDYDANNPFSSNSYLDSDSDDTEWGDYQSAEETFDEPYHPKRHIHLDDTPKWAELVNKYLYKNQPLPNH